MAKLAEVVMNHSVVPRSFARTTFLVLLLTAVSAYAQSSSEILAKIKATPPAPKGNALDLPRQYVVASIKEGGTKGAATSLAEILVARVVAQGKSKPKESEVNFQVALCNTIAFARAGEKDKVDWKALGDSVFWLTGTAERFGLFAEALTKYDKLGNALEVVKTIYALDTEDRDKFDRLIIAFALVWDTPRPPMHNQIGPALMKYEPNFKERYAYFKTLFDSRGKTKVRYKQLTLLDLIMIVDTPAPVTELTWALEEVSGSISAWTGKYEEIMYDEMRYNNRQYTWPKDQGEYSLARIEQRGGLCVDRSYFCVMTARAHGIPALYFRGEGRRGGHAWFGYMSKPGRWKLDVGRFANDGYAVGHATNPQTDQPMTDHQIEFSCNRKLSTTKYQLAAKYCKVAVELIKQDKIEEAVRYSKAARSAAPLLSDPWEILGKYYRSKGETAKTLALLQDQKKYFSKYPDYLVGVYMTETDILMGEKKYDDVMKLIAEGRRRVSKERDDLARRLAVYQVKHFLKADMSGNAIELLEYTIKNQKEEGAKTLELIDLYLKITLEHKQTKKASKYLTSVLKRLIKSLPEEERDPAAKLLLQAYENDNDKRNADKTRKKYDL